MLNSHVQNTNSYYNISMKEIKTPLQTALKHQLNKIGNIENVQLNQVLTEANVSKATFYRHYHDKYDLLNSIAIDISRKTFNQKSKQPYVTQLTYGLNMIKNNKEFFYNAFKYQGQNSIENFLIADAKIYVSDLISQHYAYAVSQTQKFAIAFYSFGMIGTIEEWIVNGCNSDPHELASQIAKQMPSSLKAILLKWDFSTI